MMVLDFYGLCLLDLVHDFAVQEAKKHGEDKKWPVTVLHGYYAAHGAEELHPCWLVEMGYDYDAGCMIRNVCRILI